MSNCGIGGKGTWGGVLDTDDNHIINKSELMEEAMEEDIYRDYGREATVQLSERTLVEPKEFKVVIEEIDTSGGKTKVQGTGNTLLVTLIDEKAHTGINAIMLKVRIFEPSFMFSRHYGFF
ncbi:hypothetical protein Tco_0658607 [Tanacetum coccineum]